jgi:hypothetical protein
MDLRSYQSAASETDCLSTGGTADLTVPLLGLAGEVGELHSEYKKALRDGDTPELFRDRFVEEMAGVFAAEVARVAGKNIRIEFDGAMHSRVVATIEGHERVVGDERVHERGRLIHQLGAEVFTAEGRGRLTGARLVLSAFLISVGIGYVSAHDHALLDFRLSLPEEWTRDEHRRQALACSSARPAG